jgi:hypothetical protein
MKYVEVLVNAQIPLNMEAEIVPSPDDESVPCLKMGNDYYSADVAIMKYSKEEKEWIEIDPEDIMDPKYASFGDVNFFEIEEEPEKAE